MKPSGDGQHHDGADGGGADNGEPFGAQQVEIFHQAHTGGHKEKSEIFYEKIGHSLNVAQMDDAALQGCCQQQHPYDA